MSTREDGVSAEGWWWWQLRSSKSRCKFWGNLGELWQPDKREAQECKGKEQEEQARRSGDQPAGLSSVLRSVDNWDNRTGSHRPLC